MLHEEETCGVLERYRCLFCLQSLPKLPLLLPQCTRFRPMIRCWWHTAAVSIRIVCQCTCCVLPAAVSQVPSPRGRATATGPPHRQAATQAQAGMACRRVQACPQAAWGQAKVWACPQAQATPTTHPTCSVAAGARRQAATLSTPSSAGRGLGLALTQQHGCGAA